MAQRKANYTRFCDKCGKGIVSTAKEIREHAEKCAG